MVHPGWSNVVTAISGTDITSASYNESSTVPMQFTIALRWAPPVDPQDVDTRVDYTEDDTWVWCGFVRKQANKVAEVRHVAEFGDPLELERVHDAKDSGLMSGRKWYRLGYEDEDVVAHEVRRGTYNAYQGIITYFQPVGTLAVDEDAGAYLVSLADEAPADRSIDWVMAGAGLALLIATAVVLFLNRRVVRKTASQPAFWLLALSGAFMTVRGFMGRLDEAREA